VRDNVSAESVEDALLLEAMCSTLVGNKQAINEGLDDNQHGLQTDFGEEPSERERGRICSGTSVGDGKEARQASDQRGGGPSQERGQAGQSHSQSGADAKARTRRVTKASLRCDVSTLQQDIPGSRQCPNCGSRMEGATPPTIPAVVLDCFGGAGTVGLVADRLQRDAVMIELNPAYAEMAERRLHRDAGMFAMVATA